MLFKKKPPEPRSEWVLAAVTRHLGLAAPLLETKEVEPVLVRARLADHYRDEGLEPVAPALFDRVASGLDAEAWRRVALAVATLDDPEVRAALVPLARTTPVARQVEAGFVGLALRTDALTLALLRQSPVRVEEFARQFAACLGVAWRGEAPDESRRRLEQLDYKRLLADADRARQLAEGRMEALRRRQEEDDARRRPRGKN